MPHSEEHEKRKSRNYALGGFLLLMVVLFFAVTVVKLKVAAS